jgi:hypothetical protein
VAKQFVMTGGEAMAMRIAITMRSARLLAAAAAALVLAGASAAAADAGSAAAGGWGHAIPVPGLAALNAGGNAQITSVSCRSAGNCAAGGWYTSKLGYTEAFVVSERNGRWGRAVEVPGTATLNRGGNAQVTSVSCGSKTACAAGGFYTDRAGHSQGFVVSERSGRWYAAASVPGLAAMNGGGNAQVTSVSCSSAGNCAAGGFYAAVSVNIFTMTQAQGFVVSERDGRWAGAVQMPVLPPASTGQIAAVTSVSCATAGNCLAGGYEPVTPSVNASPNYPAQGFVASERNGRWRTAAVPPGLAALNAGDGAEVSSVSCPSAGNCGAGGFATGGPAADWSKFAFASSQRGGRWGTAHSLSGAVAGQAELSWVVSVSCPSSGNCTTDGYQYDGGGERPVLDSERGGAWAAAVLIPGLAALNTGGASWSGSVSCPAAGDCAAGGYYTRATPGHGTAPREGFVVTASDGRWRRAIEVPGLAALNRGGTAQVSAVSCAAAGRCAAGGFYTDGRGHTQAFLDTLAS